MVRAIALTIRVPSPEPFGAPSTSTPDAIVLDDEFGATFGEPFQMDPHFAGPARISVFECIGDPFGHDHAEVDAQIGLKFQRLEVVSQRGAMALVMHGCFDIAEKARKILIEIDEPCVARTVKRLVHRRDRIDPPLCFVRAHPWRPDP